MQKLRKNIEYRDMIIHSLRQELIGPIDINPEKMIGIEVDYNSTSKIHYSFKGTRKHFYNKNTNEEIIHNGNSPITQYSSAILFPYKQQEIEIEAIDPNNPFVEIDENNTNVNEDTIKVIENRFETKDATDTEEYAMSDQIPSSISFTFFIKNLEQLRNLKFDVTGGVYKGFPVSLINEDNIEKKTYNTTWWNREKIHFNISDIVLENGTFIFFKPLSYKSLKLNFNINIRGIDSIALDGYFVTASITNISHEYPEVYKNVLFQTNIRVSYLNSSPFDPYPTSLMPNLNAEDEDLSNALLYSDVETFALGHGCSVNWDDNGTFLETTFLPEHEITNITPDIKDKNGNVLKISMLDLAENSLSDIQSILSMITTEYRDWILKREAEIKRYPTYLHSTAERHLSDCKYALNRMEQGIKLLTHDEKIFIAFKYANLAMFIQQVSGGQIQKAFIESGKVSYQLEESTLIDLPPIPELRVKYSKSNKGSWRLFQIAFLLMSLPSLPNANKSEREIADLIWFPTGGGKTEAYLAVAATNILYHRQIDALDRGTEVIMRYTLRLLTTDQFQRSARLICALELVRQNYISLFGNIEISIGLWVGKSNTPNKMDDAILQLKEWKSTGYKKHEFLINHCPLCRCEMVRFEKNAKIKGKAQYEVAGYKSSNGRNKNFIIHCPNEKCTFNKHLPIYFVDEQLYSKKPTFIIGTVDKFAMLAWEPKARSIFGVGEDGRREKAPPSLIIQDELHLISGPLGSTVGIYETLIEEMCTDYRNEFVVKPKVICATATVKGYKEQINALFAREKEKISLFPSPGLSHKNSFFAQVDLEKDIESGEWRPSRGRKYIGLASNYIGIQQLQVKAYTTVLQTAKQFDNPDAYWTLLAFYNSIRELGGSLTLFQTDISNYMLQFKNKHHIEQPLRYINSIKELTSRLENKEVTNALTELKTPFDQPKSIDVCLASNIIEVGVDVERLSLMSIVGQPKNTAQYIQVSGRVGRAWFERPGLVMTLYKLSMSRDKSHFEHFKEYHQSLYKHVEATSITPFSEPSIDRALAGIMIGWLRQFGDASLATSPVNINQFNYLFDDMYSKIENRLVKIDSSKNSLQYFAKKFNSIKSMLLSGSATLWNQVPSSNEFYFMYSLGSYVPSVYKKSALPVLTSMRNVDASCIGTISNIYNLYDLEEVEDV